MSTYDPLSMLPAVPPFDLRSSDIADGRPLGTEQLFSGMGLDGGNRSPQLEWSGFPEETESFVVSCFDPDAPTMSGFWHWLAVDIPISVTALSAGAGTPDGLPGGFHIRNDYGTRDFGGAAPPPDGSTHRYVFAVHALGAATLGVEADVSPAYAMFTAGFQTIARAHVVPVYSRG